VHVDCHLTTSDNSLADDAKLTLVMTKENRSWTIVAFHNTQVAK